MTLNAEEMKYLHINYIWLDIEPGVAPCLEGCRLNARMVLPTVQPLSNAVSLWRNTLMTTSTLSGMRLASASMSSRNDTQEWCLMLQHDALRSLFKTWCTQARSFSITMHLISPSSHPTLTTLSLLPGWSKTTKYSSRSGSLASLPAPSGLPPTEDRHLIISGSYLVSRALPGVD